MPEITIAGKTFTIEPRYSEGHTLTAEEAGALNQTFFENVRNNLAPKIKSGEHDSQEAVTAYANEYHFGIRRAGAPRPSVDPLEAEAFKVAVEKVKAAIAKAGHKNVAATVIKERAAQALDHEAHGPAIRKIAKARLDAMRKNLTDDDLGSLVEGVESGPARTRTPAVETETEQRTAPL